LGDVVEITAADVPVGALFVYGRGKVRHIVLHEEDDEGGLHRTTWCGMFLDETKLRPTLLTDADKPICGACLRTLPAALLRRSLSAWPSTSPPLSPPS
jgi:hypothetical protein